MDKQEPDPPDPIPTQFELILTLMATGEYGVREAIALGLVYIGSLTRQQQLGKEE